MANAGEPDDFLLFCLTVRSSGIAGSVRFRIESGWLALDLDNAVAQRLQMYDTDVMEHNANLISKATWGGDESETVGEQPEYGKVEVW